MLVFTLRPVTQADMSQIIQIDEDVFAPYGTAESPAVIRARQDVFPQGFVVALAEGHIVGYGSAELWQEMREPGLDEDPHITHVPQGRILCITGMAVMESYQQRGIGTAMTQYLIEVARAHTCHTIVLETTHARAFYQRLGFRVISQRQERGVKLFVMALRLV